MFRILVVDDEPYIVQSIAALLADIDRFELDVYTAESSRTALSMLQQHKYDIVLTDIRMPGMSGLDLQKEARALWPKCKVLFLTGYDEFEYIQSALKQGAVDYLLKTDGPEEIIGAINRIVHELNDDHETSKMLEKARQQLYLAKFSLKKEWLNFILQEGNLKPFWKKRFDELELQIDLETELLQIRGQVDAWKKNMNFIDRSLILYAIQNIAEEILGQHARIETIILDDKCFVWFLQPKRNNLNIDKLMIAVRENLDAIQRNCRNLLKHTISLALPEKTSDWSEFPFVFEELNQLLFRRSGFQEEQILTHRLNCENQQKSVSVSKIRSELNKFYQISKLFESRETRLFRDAYWQWINFMMHQEQNIFVEAYYKMAVFLLSFCNRTDSEHKIEAYKSKLVNLEVFATRKEAATFLFDLAEYLLDLEEQENVKNTEAVITALDNYIDENLGDDLSLLRLAEITHFNPQYLSKLYKKITGRGLSERIAIARLERAKVLLETTELQVQTISMRIGFQNSPYFTRFFKKQMGITPQEYREQSTFLHGN